jgi:hypothetical protein
VIRAYRQHVALTEDITTLGMKVTRRFYMHLENDPQIGKTASDLVIREAEVPLSVADTFLILGKRYQGRAYYRNRETRMERGGPGAYLVPRRRPIVSGRYASSLMATS